MNLYARIDLHGRNEPFAPGELDEGADRAWSTRAAGVVRAADRGPHRAVRRLDKLSAFQRSLIYLLFFKDFTQQEVADELGLTQKKVSRESIKALGRLKELLGAQVI